MSGNDTVHSCVNRKTAGSLLPLNLTICDVIIHAGFFQILPRAY